VAGIASLFVAGTGIGGGVAAGVPGDAAGGTSEDCAAAGGGGSAGSAACARARCDTRANAAQVQTDTALTARRLVIPVTISFLLDTQSSAAARLAKGGTSNSKVLRERLLKSTQ
jgi:hypothetical protein